MTPPRTMFGALRNAALLRESGKRRVLLLALFAICALFTFFPQQYRAAISLTPSDPSSLGLSGTLGQLGAVNSVFGNQTAVEISLKVARSQYVRSIVEQRLQLATRLGKSPLSTDRWLDRKMDVRALRGGILEFEITLGDAEFAQQIVGVYGDAVREQLSIIARSQTAYKRQILVELVGQASDRLARAQRDYDTFRLQTHYGSPQKAIYAEGDRVAELEQIIRDKQIELNAARQFETDENMHVRQILAEIDALNQQLQQARSTSSTQESSVGKVVQASTQADKLHRELDISQSLYDNYRRYLQGTSVEDLTSTANVRILEPAYVDTERQLNYLPMSLGMLLLLLGLAIEFYAIRPPLGEKAPA